MPAVQQVREHRTNAKTRGDGLRYVYGRLDICLHSTAELLQLAHTATLVSRSGMPDPRVI